MGNYNSKIRLKTIIFEDKNKYLQFIKNNNVLLFIVIFITISSIISDSFFTLNNILNLLTSSSIFGIIALGLTALMIIGEIDISVGAFLVFGTMVLAKITVLLNNWVWGIIGIIAVSILSGMLIGFIVGILRTNSLITTLGFQAIFIGLVVLVHGGVWVTYDKSEIFLNIARGSLLKIPIPIIVFLFLAIILDVILKKTILGKYIFATGGNEYIAWLSGIQVKKIKLIAFTICGLYVGIASVILSSRLHGSLRGKGQYYLLDAIKAVIVGGTSLYGGKGSIGKTILGIIALGLLINLLIIVGVSYALQQFYKGMLLIFALILNVALGREVEIKGERE